MAHVRLLVAAPRALLLGSLLLGSTFIWLTALSFMQPRMLQSELGLIQYVSAGLPGLCSGELSRARAGLSTTLEGNKRASVLWHIYCRVPPRRLA